MTEQNYIDPAQNQPEQPPATTTTALLERIGKLEVEVRELRDLLELAQGGKLTTLPG